MPKEAGFEDLKRQFTRTLVKVGAIKFGKFRLTSGKMSSYYVDLRVLPSYPQAFHEAVEAYTELARMVGLGKFEVVAGIPTSGMLYASALAYNLQKPLVYVRREVKDWGWEKKVEGVLGKGQLALLVDDVITTGKSVAEAANALRAEGAVVKHALVLVDRQEGGQARLMAEGVELYALLRITEILEFLLEMGEIKPHQRDAIVKQIEA